jgi:hypothetical protein
MCVVYVPRVRAVGWQLGPEVLRFSLLAPGHVVPGKRFAITPSPVPSSTEALSFIHFVLFTKAPASNVASEQDRKVLASFVPSSKPANPCTLL